MPQPARRILGLPVDAALIIGGVSSCWRSSPAS